MKMILVGLCLLIVGCSVTPQQGIKTANQANLASGHVDESLTTAKREVAAAVPHSDTTGKAHLQSADQSLASAQKQLPKIEKAAAQLETVSNELQAEQNHWVGYKARHALLTVGLIGGGCLVGLVVLFALTGAAAPTGMIAATIFHGLTLGTVAIGSRLREFVASFRKAT